MDYQKALETMHNLTKFGFNLGLERIRRLLELSGNPEKNLKVIHIGGTNGKGSTSAMVAEVLQQAGFKVGIFTSPHLHSYTERIKINGMEISQHDFAALLAELVPKFTQMVGEGYEHPTEFEVNTAMALIYFERQKTELVVLEVGLGGAIDSTNIVDPLVSVLTNVTLEHMEYLGDTVKEIARVKAGIIKKKRPVVTAVEQPDALWEIKNKCVLEDAPLYQVQKLTAISLKKTDLTSQVFDARIDGIDYLDIKLSLLGEHQLINAATALLTLKILADYYGCQITPEQVRAGFAKVVWPARMELFGANPYILIDGAHNTAGIEKLVLALKSQFQYQRLILVIGMLADKEREKAMDLIAPLAAQVIVTKPNSPRAGAWQELAAYVQKHCPEMEVIEDIQEAVETAVSIAKTDDLICITGSLYMVAAAREYLVRKLKK
jgi:dihydrofolate synthase/folylpolyglutamate synthase